MDAASDQGGPVPPEERVATLASAEGPASYRLVGVATRDEAGVQVPSVTPIMTRVSCEARTQQTTGFEE